MYWQLVNGSFLKTCEYVCLAYQGGLCQILDVHDVLFSQAVAEIILSKHFSTHKVKPVSETFWFYVINIFFWSSLQSGYLINSSLYIRVHPVCDCQGCQRTIRQT